MFNAMNKPLSPEMIAAMQKEWYEENAPLGKMLGYPECCIKAFCDQPPPLLKHAGITEDDKLRYKAGCINGMFSGLIPCATHAKEILSGKITLASLIKNRDKNQPPFPDYPHPNAYAHYPKP